MKQEQETLLTHLDTFIDFHFKTRERFGEAFCNIKEHPVTIILK